MLGLAALALPQVVLVASPELRLLMELGAPGGLAAGVALALLASQGRRPDPQQRVLAAALLGLVAPTALLVLARVMVMDDAAAASAPGALSWVSAHVMGSALLTASIVGRPRLSGPVCVLAVAGPSVVPALVAFTAAGRMAAGVSALVVVAGLLHVLAGLVASHRFWRERQSLDLWLASAAWLLASATLGSRSAVRVLGPEITTSDALRSLAVGLLCVGGLLEVRRIVRERARAAQRQAQDLDAANVLVSTMNVALDQERSFRAVALHELVTPIATIHGFAQALRRKVDRSSLAAIGPAVDSVEAESRLLQAMVGRMDELRTLDLEGFACEPRPAALRRLLEEVAVYAGGLTGGLVPAVECPDVVVHADPLRLGEALRNLVTNAVRHTSDKAQVTLRGSVDEGTGAARVAVIDAGPGIPPEERERVMRSGERGGAGGDAGPGGGQGLGLYVARRIAEAHGGDLLLGEGDDGRGLSVTLRLPPGP